MDMWKSASPKCPFIEVEAAWERRLSRSLRAIVPILLQSMGICARQRTIGLIGCVLKQWYDGTSNEDATPSLLCGLWRSFDGICLEGILWSRILYGSDHVAITNVAAYPGAFTTAIVVSYLNEAGCVRVNLDPSAWRNEGDRERYIDEWKAPVWLGIQLLLGQWKSST